MSVSIFHPMSRSIAPRMWLGLVGFALACGGGDPTPKPRAEDPQEEPDTSREPPRSETSTDTPDAPIAGAAPALPRAPVRRLTVTNPAALDGLDLSQLEQLELSLHPDDRTTWLAAGLGQPPADACKGLDLTALAERAPKLTALHLSGCGDALRVGLGQWRAQLRSLHLGDVDLDPVLAARVADLPALERLSLHRVQVREPEAVRSALAPASVSSLHLAAGNVRLLNVLRGMTRPLNDLTIEGAWLDADALSALSRLRHLRRLSLIQTDISNYGLSFIRRLPGLEQLVLDETSINNQSPMFLGGLPLLEFTCRCPRFGDTGARHLRQFKSLEALRLDGTQITPEGIAHLGTLKNLTSLDLRSATLDTAALETIAALPSLRRLHLERSVVDRGAMKALLGATALTELTLRVRGLDDRSLAPVRQLTSLRRLDLQGTDISDAGLRSLRVLTEMEALVLRGTRVTRSGFASLASLTNLHTLDLGDTDLVDDAVGEIASISSLRALSLDGTLVTPRCLDALGRMPNLETLSMHRTAVDASDVLRALPSLRIVNGQDSRAGR